MQAQDWVTHLRPGRAESSPQTQPLTSHLTGVRGPARPVQPELPSPACPSTPGRTAGQPHGQHTAVARHPRWRRQCSG